jgi:hypothetical protein
MLRVVSHPEADEELEAAALWYEQRQPGLGDDFLDDFELALRRVIQDPQLPRFIQGENLSTASLTPSFMNCKRTFFT